MAPWLTGSQKGKIALLFYVDIIVFALMSCGWQTHSNPWAGGQKRQQTGLALNSFQYFTVSTGLPRVRVEHQSTTIWSHSCSLCPPVSPPKFYFHACMFSKVWDRQHSTICLEQFPWRLSGLACFLSSVSSNLTPIVWELPVLHIALQWYVWITAWCLSSWDMVKMASQGPLCKTCRCFSSSEPLCCREPFTKHAGHSLWGPSISLLHYCLISFN